MPPFQLMNGEVIMTQTYTQECEHSYDRYLLGRPFVFQSRWRFGR